MKLKCKEKVQKAGRKGDVRLEAEIKAGIQEEKGSEDRRDVKCTDNKTKSTKGIKENMRGADRGSR